jgi:polyisoprenoid-binding protein YceI
MRMLVSLSLALSLILSLPALASWQLDNEQSKLSYTSIKNEQVAEVNYFKQLSGTISERSEVLFEVNLLSVETNILLRNERLQQFLFETNLYPKARFIAELPKDLINSVKVGESKAHQLSGVINLHGVIKDVSVEVMVSRLADNKLVVSSVMPLLIKAQDFNLEAGIAKLQEIAKLPGITSTVPVQFTLTFKQ